MCELWLDRHLGTRDKLRAGRLPSTLSAGMPGPSGRLSADPEQQLPRSPRAGRGTLEGTRAPDNPSGRAPTTTGGRGSSVTTSLPTPCPSMLCSAALRCHQPSPPRGNVTSSGNPLLKPGRGHTRLWNPAAPLCGPPALASLLWNSRDPCQGGGPGHVPLCVSPGPSVWPLPPSQKVRGPPAQIAGSSIATARCGATVKVAVPRGTVHSTMQPGSGANQQRRQLPQPLWPTGAHGTTPWSPSEPLRRTRASEDRQQNAEGQSEPEALLGPQSPLCSVPPPLWTPALLP